MSFTESAPGESRFHADPVQAGPAAQIAAQRLLNDAVAKPLLADLSAAEVRRLRLEGRRAAFEGHSLARCPYGLCDPARRKAWLSGYSGER